MQEENVKLVHEWSRASEADRSIWFPFLPKSKRNQMALASIERNNRNHIRTGKKLINQTWRARSPKKFQKRLPWSNAEHKLKRTELRVSFSILFSSHFCVLPVPSDAWGDLNVRPLRAGRTCKVIMNESDLITGVGRLGVGNFSVCMNRSWFLNNFRSIALRVTEVGGKCCDKARLVTNDDKKVAIVEPEVLVLLLNGETSRKWWAMTAQLFGISRANHNVKVWMRSCCSASPKSCSIKFPWKSNLSAFRAPDLVKTLLWGFLQNTKSWPYDKNAVRRSLKLLQKTYF